MKKFLLTCLLLFTSFAIAQNDETIKVNHSFLPEQLSFQYIQYSGKDIVQCKHDLIHPLTQDWGVNCGKNKYVVHLWVTEYTKSVSPKQSFEILYWVTDHNISPVQYSSSTHWLRFKEIGTAHSFSLSQGLEGDTAGLYLDILF